MLQTAPYLSVFTVADGIGGEGDGEQKNQDAPEAGEASLQRTVTIGDVLPDGANADFSFTNESHIMGFIEEEEEEGGTNLSRNLNSGEEVEPASPPMYLATGLGLEDAGFGDNNISSLEPALPSFEDESDEVDYYKRMVDNFPCHPLFLRRYAEVLKAKGDLQEAEDYFYRATLAGPDDGEILAQYAQFVWDIHHDREKALTFFMRAAKVAPQDSHVLAAYAKFAWEIEDENDSGEENLHEEMVDRFELLNSGEDYTAINGNRNENSEYYWRKILAENPCDPLALKNYAKFFYQSEGDIHEAEDLYSRAAEANPMDGEVLAMYAKLVWQLHHDYDKASSYFERAAQASPADSNVLGSYASFLWETEKDEEDSQGHIREASPQAEAIFTTSS